MKMVYLDYNATTPHAAEVLEEMVISLRDDWGNPSSSYELGQKAKFKINQARTKVAEMISARSSEIIFTSGGTEANNLVIHTAIEYFNQHHTSNDTTLELPHMITTTIEHDSISLPLEHLRNRKTIEVTFVPVSKVTGAVQVSDIVAALRPNTCLVTIMLANNETGAIQPVPEISRGVQNWMKQNQKLLKCPILIHTDAAQALGKIPVNVSDLGVNYLTIVGHKFYGPRIGALFAQNIGDTSPLYPQLFGGGQETGYRPGTENTAMIAGLGKASELVSKNELEYSANFGRIKSYLEEKLKKTFGKEVTFNNHFQGVQVLPNTVSVSFRNETLKGRSVLSQCKLLMASVGAACHSGGGPSKVLIASGISPSLAKTALRLSVGRETVEKDIDEAVDDLAQAVEAVKKLSKV